MEWIECSTKFEIIGIFIFSFVAPINLHNDNWKVSKFNTIFHFKVLKLETFFRFVCSTFFKEYRRKISKKKHFKFFEILSSKFCLSLFLHFVFWGPILYSHLLKIYCSGKFFLKKKENETNGYYTHGAHIAGMILKYECIWEFDNEANKNYRHYYDMNCAYLKCTLPIDAYAEASNKKLERKRLSCT